MHGKSGPAWLSGRSECGRKHMLMLHSMGEDDKVSASKLEL